MSIALKEATITVNTQSSLIKITVANWAQDITIENVSDCIKNGVGVSREAVNKLILEFFQEYERVTILEWIISVADEEMKYNLLR